MPGPSKRNAQKKSRNKSKKNSTVAPMPPVRVHEPDQAQYSVIPSSRVYEPAQAQSSTMTEQVDLSGLYGAARDGNIEEVRRLLSLLAAAQSADGFVSQLPLKQRSAFVSPPPPTAKQRIQANIKLVAAIKAILHVKDDTEELAFVAAQDVCHLHCLEAFSEGADINFRDSQSGVTVLMLAAAYGHVSIVNFLLAQNPAINAVDSRGATALLHAAKNGREAVVKVLVAYGAALDIATTNHETALTAAIRSGNLPIVECLLRAGANFDATDGLDHTALHKVAMSRSDDARKMATLLLKCGADINIVAIDGMTPLLLAVMDQNLNMVDFFIRAGADVSVCTEWGDNIFHLAMVLKQFDLCEHMLSLNRTLIDVQRQNGARLLTMAIEGGEGTLVRQLLGHGARTDLTDDDGRTALMYAVELRLPYMVEILASHPGKDTFSGAGYNPLIFAITIGHKEIVQILLNQGADRTIGTKEGYTLAELAKSLGCQEIFALLEAPVILSAATPTFFSHHETEGHEKLLQDLSDFKPM